MTRRIVTGHDASGASTIISDGESPWCASFSSIPGFQVSMLWATNGTAIRASDALPDAGDHLRGREKQTVANGLRRAG